MPGDEALDATVPESADGLCQAERGDEIVLRVRVLPGESFRGFVGHSHDEVPLSFNGWIDFMGAVNALRAPEDHLNATQS